MPRRYSRPLSWYIIWTFIFLVSFSILSGFILSLPIWQVKQVRVAGNSFMESQKIMNVASITLGTNIFMIDPAEIREKYSKIIQIKGIRIMRRLPSTIVIAAEERKPFAIAVIGSSTCLIDDEGVIIAKNNLSSSIYRTSIAQYPVIRGISQRSLEKGIRIDPVDMAFIAASVKLFSRFIDPSRIQMDVSNRSDITVYIEDILKVKIGAARDIENKIRITNALIGSLQGKYEKVAYIDVRVPENPVIKFK